MRWFVATSFASIGMISTVLAQAPCDRDCRPQRCIYSKKFHVDPYCGDINNLNLKILLEKFKGDLTIKGEDGQEIDIKETKPAANATEKSDEKPEVK